MKKLWDELDENGVIVQRGIQLTPFTPPLAENHRWVPHTPELEVIKQTKKAEIETRRNLECYKPVESMGYWWQADARSQSLLSNAILTWTLTGIPSVTTWRTLDNQDIPVTLEDLKAIAQAMAQQTNLAYQISWKLKRDVELAETEEELNKLIWSM